MWTTSVVHVFLYKGEKMLLYQERDKLWDSFERGSALLSKCTSSTLGPHGKLVMMGNKMDKPHLTKDGVTVAKFVRSNDPFEQMAIDILRESAEETNKQTGDGTTTTSILAHEMLKEAILVLKHGFPARAIVEGMRHACKKIKASLFKLSHPVDSYEMIRNIANISSNNDEQIADLILTAVENVGRNGAITVEESKTNDSSVEIVEGFMFDSGLVNSIFANDELRGVCVFHNPLIMVTDHKISHLDDILPLLKTVAHSGRSLVIVAEEYEGEALSALTLNAARGSMKVAAIKAPRFGQERKNILEDLAIACGAVFLSKERGYKLKEVTLENLGQCKKSENGKNHSVFVGTAGETDKIETRLQYLKNLLLESDVYEAKETQERISRLASTVAVVRVGGQVDSEKRERKERVIDALEAVASAQKTGVLPGGGVTYHYMYEKTLKKSKHTSISAGEAIVYNALATPFGKLCENFGINSKSIKQKISRVRGYDFKNQKFVNMMKAGIIDPTAVAIAALENAVASVIMLVSTENAVFD